MNAKELFDQGQLNEAIAAATAVVKKRPTDGGERGFLAILLAFAGEIDRADAQLETMVRFDPEAEVGVNLTRQLLRAEKARLEWHFQGRVPLFLKTPGEREQLHLRASVHLRDGELAAAAELLERSEELRGESPGRSGGEAFDDFRDVDDLVGGYFEVLTSTGKFYLVPVSDVRQIAFHAPERARDLLWRRATLTVDDGPEGDVYLPAIYPIQGRVEDEERLGRMTDWTGGEGEPIRGRGLRTFLVGDEPKTLLDLEDLAFARATKA